MKKKSWSTKNYSAKSCHYKDKNTVINIKGSVKNTVFLFAQSL